MRKLILIAILSFYMLSCKKSDIQSRILDNSYIPSITDITYSNNNLYLFEGDSGHYKFSYETTDNNYRIRVKHSFYLFSPTSDSIEYTYTYDEAYNLITIDRSQTSFIDPVSIKLIYDNNKLIGFKEIGNGLTKEFNISRTIENGFTKLIIQPYMEEEGNSINSVTHYLIYNSNNKLVETNTKKTRFENDINIRFERNCQYSYSGNDIDNMNSYVVVDSVSPTINGKDSTYIVTQYLRENNENPILYSTFQKMYGQEFYDIITHLNIFFQFTTNQLMRMITAPNMNERTSNSNTETAKHYRNGNLLVTSILTDLNENIVDSNNRLIRSKVNLTSIAPDYYSIWNVIYRD